MNMLPLLFSHKNAMKNNRQIKGKLNQGFGWSLKTFSLSVLNSKIAHGSFRG